MNFVVLHQQVDEQSTADELDVLVQATMIAEVLKRQGHDVQFYGVTLDLESLKSYLLRQKPDMCVNLVETVDGSGRLLHVVPAVLEKLAIPFTGSGSEALYITTNKVLAKERMDRLGISTPDWTTDGEPTFDPPYIVKPISEDASVDIDEHMVVYSREAQKALVRGANGRFFTERYINGREFNMSILASGDGPEVLPPAEMLFEDYPPDKPRVVGYKAKWQADSFEFNHTVRRFEYLESDAALLRQLADLSLRCWQAFQLCGYARVDFRVDENGLPWVLEINANPCISPDSGFVAAAERAGLDFDTIVRRLIDDATQKDK